MKLNTERMSMYSLLDRLLIWGGRAIYQIGVAPLGRYITAHGPSMARPFNAARAIFDTPVILKW